MVLEVNGPKRVPHPTKNDRPPHDLASAAATVDARNAVKVERSITIRAPREKLYAFWRDFGNHPRFMKYLESVDVLDDRRSHWKMALRGGRVAWDSEIVNDLPNELIAWKTVGDSDVAHAGSVHFDDAGNGETVVRWVMDYEPPGGKSGRMLSRVLGALPEQLIDQDLQRFKQLIESQK